jgi:hypothetical protein
VASKSPIYYIKCPFCQQNLINKKTGSPEDNENYMKKHLNLCKTLTRRMKCFLSCLTSENKVFQLSG